MKCKFQYPWTKFSWDTAIPLPPHIVYAAFLLQRYIWIVVLETVWILESEHLLADLLLMLADPHPINGTWVSVPFCHSFHGSFSGYLLSIYHIGQVFCQVLRIRHRAKKGICVMKLTVWLCSRRKKLIKSSYRYLCNYSPDGCRGMVPGVTFHHALIVGVIIEDCQTSVHTYSPTVVLFSPFSLFLPWDSSSSTRFFF